MFAQIVYAQNNVQENDSLLHVAQKINKKEAIEAVSNIASLIKENYVFPGMGKSISDSLLKK
ncbi:hypothetical protein [Niabella ginsengisoli]|uniref:Uncharacterized protein n=1 Tax=Niabella ginsengisoli TaxID=522298 RepID=A0ABS9SJ66_9BACT|nr:hypothetical protein [Niabella ginsengisoli]MCH5598376.1 hypothetical protein [Niabella ginsengisoli]